MYDIKKAFEGLNVEENVFEKSKKGEKKVGNPRYRKVHKDGKIVYVLVNKEEHPNQDSKIDEENFERLHSNGRVERHYDEAPVVRSLDDLRHIDWIPNEKVDIIKRCLERVSFYDKSIAFAKATGNNLIMNAHSANRDNQLKTIDTVVKRAFNGKNFDGLTKSDLDILREMKVDVSINPSNIDDALDYINNTFTGFDLIKLCEGMKKAVDSQKKKLSKIGINPSEFNPKIKVELKTSGFNITMENSNNRVTDNAGYKCDLGMFMSRSFSGSANNKRVSHNVFVLGKKGTNSDNEQNPLRQGFAKKIMTNFFEQYKNCDMDEIEVHAAPESYGGGPYNGANTWGRWGFRCTKSTANQLINHMKSNFSENKMKLVDEFVIEHSNEDDISTYKKNENGFVSKISYKKGLVEGVDGRNIDTKIITKETSDGKFRSKVLISKTIGPEDVKQAEKILNDYFSENQGTDIFRVKDWYEKMDGAVIRGLLSDTFMWTGKVNMNDGSNREDFEKNVNKKYERVTEEDIANFESKNS